MALLAIANVANAAWYDSYISYLPFKDNVSETQLPYQISESSVVALNSVEIKKSEYEVNTITTTQRKILPVDSNPRTAGQCVGWVKYVTGVPFVGNAINWWKYVNTQVPEIDSIVVLKTGPVGHVGIVIDKTETEIIVRSRNYQGLWIVSDDKFDISDKKILGYIK